MKILKNYKQVRDNVHGFISLSGIACRIIDTPEFQRLRHLHQLGTCFFVYPNATHTRFEHSLGTYHLANRMLMAIRKNIDPVKLNEWLDQVIELKEYCKRTYGDKKHHKLDDYVCELVKIAALCHDIGHGPFSHAFDDFINSVKNNYKNNKEFLHQHENRSLIIFRRIIRNDKVLKTIITESDIEFIESIINPTENHKGFIYQIVSNNFNSIDVDKYDYLTRDSYNLGLKFGFDCSRLTDDVRVINNIICFPEQLYYEIASVFKTRYRLYKQIYTHKVSIATQFMINEIMVLLDPILNIYESIYNIEKFCEFTDSYIISIVKHLYNNIEQFKHNDKKKIRSAYNILDNLNRRNLYKFIGSIVSDKPFDLSFSDIKKIDPDIKCNDIFIHTGKIGFVSGKKDNPLNELYFYKNKNPDVCFQVHPHQKTYLISDTYQEYVYTLYVKDRKNDDLVNKMIGVFEILDKAFKL